MANLNIKLKIWRQANKEAKGQFVDYTLEDITTEMSFLEMLDVLNEKLTRQGEDPVCFEHDCREGICGCCGIYINGRAHGPQQRITTCQLYMRHFKDGETIVLEPWRAKAFPVIKDLMVDRSAFDRIIAAGGFISINAGGAPDANANLITKHNLEKALDAAECIGCGACVAACKNASAMLFVSAKIAHLNRLPQGKPERDKRAFAMLEQMEKEGFGSCTNTEACSYECPRGISMDVIAETRREYFRASVLKEKV